MSTPLWRQMYNSWEKAVAPGLQEVTASNGFRDLLAVALKTNADIAREIERTSRQWLHLWNLPAASDVRRLRQQITGLERDLLSLRLELERRGADVSPGSEPTDPDATHAPADSEQTSATITKTALSSANGRATSV